MEDEIYVRLCGNSFIVTSPKEQEQVTAKDAWGMIADPGAYEAPPDIWPPNEVPNFWPYTDEEI